MDPSVKDLYFESYNNLHIHNLMLKDEPRTKAYYDAIMNNKTLFKDKIVLDVGAGTGILSLFCAFAGAKKVYAVEAVPELGDLINKLADANNFSEIITVVVGELEKLEPVEGLFEESVDILVSEFMGFYLLHEGMLDSVISARKFLKEDGLIFPEKCCIQAALCEVPDFYDWEKFYNLDFTIFGDALRASSQTEPQLFNVNVENLLSEAVDILSLDTRTVCATDIEEINKDIVVPAIRDGKFQGVCLWFVVEFPSASGDAVKLSSSPWAPKTHWKQTVIILPNDIPIEEGDPVGFNIKFKKNSLRKYTIEFEVCDACSIPHTTPCSCNEMKCRIIKSFIESSETSMAEE